MKIADENKVFAYKGANGEEIVLGSILCLGKNDDGSRYYQVDNKEEEEDGKQEYTDIESNI